jgi:SAM-dependent methyltransferase
VWQGTASVAKAFVSNKLKDRIPWYLKIPIKIMISRFPVEPRFWQDINVFRAGTMDSPECAFAIFKLHYDAANLQSLIGCSVLEIGPGNSGLTAIFARSVGASRTWLIDTEPLASQDARLFRETEHLLLKTGLPALNIGAVTSVDEALRRLNASYLTAGLESLKKIPDAEVDFLFSNAVLEHVRLGEFSNVIAETRRILKPTGIASHVIDFRDHLQHGLNNLRFPERVWESEFMARSGFYTNRIPWPDMERIFRSAGFSVELRNIECWPDGLPTKQSSMARSFRQMSADSLKVMAAHVLLRPLT